LHKNGDLVLGPFQGKIACTRIGPGKGVCGAAVEKKESMLVSDVHKFKGHIACDSESKSELVIPIFWNESVVGVLDVDSLVTNGFDNNDKMGLEKIVTLLQQKCNWKQLVPITHPQKSKKKIIPTPQPSYFWRFVTFGGILSFGLIVAAMWKFKVFDMFQKNNSAKLEYRLNKY